MFKSILTVFKATQKVTKILKPSLWHFKAKKLSYLMKQITFRYLFNFMCSREQIILMYTYFYGTIFKFYMLSFSMILCQLPQAGFIENTFFSFYRAFTISKYLNLVILPGAIADRASNINILKVKY